MKSILCQCRRCVLAFVALYTAGISQAQVVITEVMHNPGGDDALWEWVEVLNTTAAPVDLNGWVFDDDDDSSFAAANISSSGGTRNTIVPASGVAVLYPGDELDFMPARFNAAWGGGVTLIGVDGFTTLTGTDSIGLWSNHANYMADAIPGATSSPRRTFASAAAALNYATGFPTASTGHSIAWNGTAPTSSGANWEESEAGSLGAFESVETSSVAQINSTNDRGNPGVLPAGAAAADLLITEIMFDPDSPLGSTQFAEADFEWIEVRNNTANPINFAATPYVFDDNSGSQLSEANISAGTLAAGQTGVLFNDDLITLAGMQAMWGAGINYIPVEVWPTLNNTGDTIAIWDSLDDYNNEAVTGTGRTHDNAVADVIYDTVAADGWPTNNDRSSIWLDNLSGDPNLGENWTRAGAEGDTLSYQASAISGPVIDHPGGDVGSPGDAPGAVTPDLPGDFNGDNKVDAADYVVWRKSGGPPSGYDTWRSGFGDGASGGGSAQDGATTVPEPTSVVLLTIAVIAVIRRLR